MTIKRLTIFSLATAILVFSVSVARSADDAYSRSDYKTAQREYAILAKQGHAGAQTNLGIKYALGQGVIKDHVYAHMWLNIGLSAGVGKARNRDLIEQKMTRAKIAEAQRLARECVRKKFKGC